MTVNPFVVLKAFFSPIVIEGLVIVIFSTFVFAFLNRKADAIIKKIRQGRK